MEINLEKKLSQESISIDPSIFIQSNQPLGDRMKQYESEMDLRIKPYESFVIRLDGRSFSKFTKGFSKPFDINFIKVMSMTMGDLVKKFEAQTGYTHSDEITLIFAPRCSKEEFDLLDNLVDNLINNSTNNSTQCAKIQPVESVQQNQQNQYTQAKIISSHPFDGRVQKLLSLTSSYCSVNYYGTKRKIFR